jgi:hypothetical protein
MIFSIDSVASEPVRGFSQATGQLAVHQPVTPVLSEKRNLTGGPSEKQTMNGSIARPSRSSGRVRKSRDGEGPIERYPP